MTNEQSRHEHYQEILNEHLELQVILDRIQAIFADPSRDRGPFAEAISELRSHLDVHFQTEEKEGFFKDIVSRAPWLKDSAEELRKEHGEMLETIQGVSAHLAQGEPSDSWWGEVKGLYDKFVSQFVHHEHEENRLVQEAYNRDVGDKD